MTSQATDWEELFVKYMSDTGLVFWIYKDHLKLLTKQPICKMYNWVYLYFTKNGEEVKRCSTSPIIKEIQTKFNGIPLNSQ